MSLRRTAILLPALWMGVFLLAPALILLAIAFGEPAEALPPFRPPWRHGPEGWAFAPNAGNLALLAEDGFYLAAFGRSLLVAGATGLLAVLVGYPMALAIARAPESWRLGLLLALMLPFWTSFLLRVTAWIGILQEGGWLDRVAMALGLAAGPLGLLYSDAALLIGMTYVYLPFAVLPLYASLSRQDPALREAAADLGATPWRVFVGVTLPLSAPGIVAGFLLVLIPAIGEFVVPELLGGPGAQLLGRVVWAEFFQNRDWPMAATLAVVLLALLLAPIALFQARLGRR
jgi:putrescine transport system permease protein